MGIKNVESTTKSSERTTDDHRIPPMTDDVEEKERTRQGEPT